MAEIKASIKLEDVQEYIEKRIQELKKEFITKAAVDKMVEEILSVRAVMDQMIIDEDRKDLINFVNGINQCLVIIDKYRNEESENAANEHI